MQTRLPFIVLSLFCLVYGNAASAPQPQATPSPVVVYHNDQGIKPPQLLSSDLSQLVSSDCKQEAEGVAALSLVIDSNGEPKKIHSLDPLADDMDRMAIAILKSEHFSPAMRQGSPVPLARELHIYLALCVAKVPGNEGKTEKLLRLTSLPVQKLLPDPESPDDTTLLSTDEEVSPSQKPNLFHVGAGVSPPVPILTPAPTLTTEDRKIKFTGTCIVSVMLDAAGVPRHVRITRGINPQLDQRALEAVEAYRFKPAMAGKKPVPITMAIQVSFNLY